MVYKKIPILDVARRCGIVLHERTLDRGEVQAKCPFCGDKAKAYHLFLNTENDFYHCQLCKRGGNSLTLYARLNKLTNNQALKELTGGSNVYHLPSEPIPSAQPEREPLSLAVRDMVYRLMLDHLTLSEKHRKALRKRGLSDGQIERNGYRSTPTTDRERRLLAAILADYSDLLGIPGFYSDDDGAWTIYWAKGILIPVRTADRRIEGLQIRLDNTTNGKYRWFGTRYLENGTRAYSWLHVTGDTTSRTAYLTEGPLKGDLASFLDHNALFICVAGINALDGLEEVLAELDLRELVICLDMDKVVNPNVEAALWRIQAIAAHVPGLCVRIKNWNPGIKGIDDLYLAQETMGFTNRSYVKDTVAEAIEARWEQKYPRRDREFVSLCQWREREIPVCALECSEPAKDDVVRIEDYRARLQAGETFPPLVCVNSKVADDKELFHAYQAEERKVVRIYENLPWQEELAA